jgi:hypothetical protein
MPCVSHSKSRPDGPTDNDWHVAFPFGAMLCCSYVALSQSQPSLPPDQEHPIAPALPSLMAPGLLSGTQVRRVVTAALLRGVICHRSFFNKGAAKKPEGG